MFWKLHKRWRREENVGGIWRMSIIVAFGKPHNLNMHNYERRIPQTPKHRYYRRRQTLYTQGERRHDEKSSDKTSERSLAKYSISVTLSGKSPNTKIHQVPIGARAHCVGRGLTRRM